MGIAALPPVVFQVQPPALEKASSFERAVVQEMSDARVRPRAWAKILREFRDGFEGTLWKRPGRCRVQWP